MQKNIAHFFKPCGKFQALVPDNSIEFKTLESGETSSSTFTETIGPKPSVMSNEQNTKSFTLMNAFLFQTLRLEIRIDLASISGFANIHG